MTGLSVSGDDEVEARAAELASGAYVVMNLAKTEACPMRQVSEAPGEGQAGHQRILLGYRFLGDVSGNRCAHVFKLFILVFFFVCSFIRRYYRKRAAEE